MICPHCHSQMIKVRQRAGQGAPNQIRCVDCRFEIYYTGLGDQPARTTKRS